MMDTEIGEGKKAGRLEGWKAGCLLLFNNFGFVMEPQVRPFPVPRDADRGILNRQPADTGQGKRGIRKLLLDSRRNGNILQVKRNNVLHIGKLLFHEMKIGADHTYLGWRVEDFVDLKPSGRRKDDMSPIRGTVNRLHCL
jgi:hypothetical protein